MLDFDPNSHVVMRVPLGDWLRREFAPLPLFVMWNRKARTFVIAEWRGVGPSGNGRCVEWLVIGESLGDFDREAAGDLRRRLWEAPGLAARMKRQGHSALMADDRNVQRHQDELHDFARFLNRKQGGNDPLTAALAAG